MSIAYQPSRAPVPAGARHMETAAIAGMLLGAVGFLAGAHGSLAAPRAYAMTPQEFSAWTGAIFSAVMGAANTAWFVWHRFHQPPRKPRRKRPRPDAPKPPPAA